MDNSFSTTWADTLEDFFVDVQTRLAPKTLHYYQTQLRPLARWAESEGVTFSQFRARNLKEYLIKRGDDGVTDRTRHHDAVAAGVFFKYCEENKLIAENPLARYKKPRVARASIYKPTVQEMQKVLAAISRRWDIQQNAKARFLAPQQRRFYAAREYAIICCKIASAGALSSGR